MTEPMLRRHRIAAPVAYVRHALTDPAALRTWLAEHAEVALPHRYEFWGRYTPSGDVPRQRLLHADDHTVRFAWELDGTDTTVEISLAAENENTTILRLTHTNLPGYAEMVAEEGLRSLLPTFWALAIANLADHVEGRALTPKCDFTSQAMRAEVVIDAPVPVVYASIADPVTFTRWFGATIEAEQYEGGRWAMGGLDANSSPARIVTLDPDRAMAIEWPGGMVNSWELADSDGRTRLTFVQSGFNDDNPPYGAWMGMLAGLAELRRFHEVADWHPACLEVRQDGMPEGLLVNEGAPGA